MRSPFNFKGQHDCEAVVIPCIDFRFHQSIFDFIRNDLNIKTFDLLSAPGCAKSFLEENYAEILKEKINTVSVGLHNIKKIVLINHADCGAYGGRSAFSSLAEELESHKKDLAKVKKMLEEAFPKLEIIIAIANLTDDMSEVEVTTI